MSVSSKKNVIASGEVINAEIVNTDVADFVEKESDSKEPVHEEIGSRREKSGKRRGPSIKSGQSKVAEANASVERSCETKSGTVRSGKTKSGKEKTMPKTVASAAEGNTPAASRNIELSESERKRRQRHELEKRHHIPTAAELAYPHPLPVWEPGWLLIQGARHNNLKSIDVPFPLSAFTAVTGVSGSGKSSLVEDILYRALAKSLHRAQVVPGAYDSLQGIECINKVIQVDQRPIGQTPTSNPATYTGVFDLIRQFYAQLPDARLRGYTPRRFSFNLPGGRCEKCEGAGQLKIEMHFLADVWITCDACRGKRYDQQTLEIKYHGKSIADVLEMSCGEARKLFAHVPAISRILQMLCDVGLDYIALGQPAPTLSGGESQRVKLATELARPDTGRTLYLLDEPTTGLHFEDLQRLLKVLHRLVDIGNTVILIEHNLDIIKSADWIVDIGPEAGLEGGHLIFTGTPEQLVEYGRRWLALSPVKKKTMMRSHTAEALIPVFEQGVFEERPLFDAAAYFEEQQKLLTGSAGVSDDDVVVTEPVQMPWEVDGRLWHTQKRVSRNGVECKWDGDILADIVDRIEETKFFAETDWNNRTIVEVRAERKSLGWFFHAITGEEWLLKLKFRVPRNTFKKDLLIRQLNLRPLNEMDEIPLYGTQPRVRVETTGFWQEIELKVYSYNEINREEFWNFLDLAISQFGRFVDKAQESIADLTPWKTQGKQWHLTPEHCYGGNDKPYWKMKLLEKLLSLILTVSPESAPVWTNKIIVPFYQPKQKHPWCQLYTKNCECICLQLNVPKNTVPLGSVIDIGRDPEVDGSNVDYDTVYLRFQQESDLKEQRLRSLLERVLTLNG